MAWWQCRSTPLNSHLRTRELVPTINIHIDIDQHEWILQDISLLIGRSPTETHFLPPLQRLPQFCCLKHKQQVVPRGTRARTCTPRHSRDTLARGLRIISPDQTKMFCYGRFRPLKHRTVYRQTCHFAESTIVSRVFRNTHVTSNSI